MGFFGRRKAADGTHTTTHMTTHHKERRYGRHHESYSMARRRSFGQWIKHTWLDILTMAAMGAIGLGVHKANPAPSRSFAVTFSDGEVVYPEFAYPMRKEVVPIWLAAFLASVIPIAVIPLMQIRVRSFWDANNGIIGLLYSLTTTAVFQVFVKWLIGGLRPHFLDACKPDLSKAATATSGYNLKGFQQLYFRRELCKGDEDEINDSLESMPSGHTTAAFAGFVFLYLYLNAKLKVFSNYHPAMWKLIVIYAPILGAVLIGGALTIDEYHNWYDIFASAAIGTVMAISSYRMTYAAIWDWRFNHIPLNRDSPFAYHMGGADLVGAGFTSRAGWRGGGWGQSKEAAVGREHLGGTGQGHHASPTIPRRAVGALRH